MSVRCGNRKVHNNVEIDIHHHETVAQVRLCYSRPEGLESIEEIDLFEYRDAEARSEIEAEQAIERYYEGWGYDDGFNEWEASRGLISYEEARSVALVGGGC